MYIVKESIVSMTRAITVDLFTTGLGKLPKMIFLNKFTVHEAYFVRT